MGLSRGEQCWALNHADLTLDSGGSWVMKATGRHLLGDWPLSKVTGIPGVGFTLTYRIPMAMLTNFTIGLRINDEQQCIRLDVNQVHAGMDGTHINDIREPVGAGSVAYPTSPPFPAEITDGQLGSVSDPLYRSTLIGFCDYAGITVERGFEWEHPSTYGPFGR